MGKDKIFELRIEEDDEISGVDQISLVDEPAIEVNWIAFNKQKSHEFHIPDGEDEKYVQMLVEKAEDEQSLFDQGYVIDAIEYMDGKSKFATDPNAPSEWDDPEFLVRYKYMLRPNISQAAIIPTTRQFCANLINKNYVWRVEEMESLVNNQGSSALVWRGGYNCRHIWGKIRYKKDATIVNKASINKGKITEGDFPTDMGGEFDILGYPQPETVTEKTLNNPSPSTIRNLGLAKEKFEVGVPHYTKDGKLYEGPTHKDANGRLMTGAVHTEDSVYLYHIDELAGEKVSIDFDDTLSTDRGKEMAKKLIEQGYDLHIVTRRQQTASEEVYKVAEEIGIPRDKVHFTNGKLKWELLKRLGIKIHIDNNPDEIKAIKENAPDIEAIKFGYDVGGITGYVDPGITGKTKSDYDSYFNQFKGENFKSYSDYPDSVKNNAKAVLKYAEENGWGPCGTDVGKQRANQLANGEPISEDTIKRMYSYLSRHAGDLDSSKGYGDGCGKLMYDAWGGKTALSWAESKINAIEREKMSKQQFQTDDDKRIVLGPAMIPDLKIFRKDEKGNPYYVYFSADTIKTIAEKYMRNKYLDNNDMMHNGKAVQDVYVYESWIKEHEEDKANKYGYGDLPIGTWFVAMKVRNDDVWNKIKAGELKGFSVSGYFEEVAKFAREEMFLQRLAELLKQID
jgi:hypothetical protein